MTSTRLPRVVLKCRGISRCRGTIRQRLGWVVQGDRRVVIRRRLGWAVPGILRDGHSLFLSRSHGRITALDPGKLLLRPSQPLRLPDARSHLRVWLLDDEMLSLPNAIRTPTIGRPHRVATGKTTLGKAIARMLLEWIDSTGYRRLAGIAPRASRRLRNVTPELVTAIQPLASGRIMGLRAPLRDGLPGRRRNVARPEVGLHAECLAGYMGALDAADRVGWPYRGNMRRSADRRIDQMHYDDWPLVDHTSHVALTVRRRATIRQLRGMCLGAPRRRGLTSFRIVGHPQDRLTRQVLSLLGWRGPTAWVRPRYGYEDGPGWGLLIGRTDDAFGRIFDDTQGDDDGKQAI